MKRGTQNRTRFLDITDISTNLGSDLSESITGIHAFTGCDLVSAFAGKRRVAALQVLRKHPSLQKTFSMFGEEIEVKYRSLLKKFHFVFDFEHICFHFSGEGKKQE